MNRFSLLFSFSLEMGLLRLHVYSGHSSKKDNEVGVLFKCVSKCTIDKRKNTVFGITAWSMNLK